LLLKKIIIMYNEKLEIEIIKELFENKEYNKLEMFFIDELNIKY